MGPVAEVAVDQIVGDHHLRLHPADFRHQHLLRVPGIVLQPGLDILGIGHVQQVREGEEGLEVPKPVQIGAAGAFPLAADGVAAHVGHGDGVAPVRVGGRHRAEDQHVVVAVGLHDHDVRLLQGFLPVHGLLLQGHLLGIEHEQLRKVAGALQHGHAHLPHALLREHGDEPDHAAVLPGVDHLARLVQAFHQGPAGDAPPFPVHGSHVHLVLPLHAEPVALHEVHVGGAGVVGEDPHVGLLHMELDGALTVDVVGQGGGGQRQDKHRDQYR